MSSRFSRKGIHIPADLAEQGICPSGRPYGVFEGETSASTEIATVAGGSGAIPVGNDHVVVTREVTRVFDADFLEVSSVAAENIVRPGAIGSALSSLVPCSAAAMGFGLLEI